MFVLKNIIELMNVAIKIFLGSIEENRGQGRSFCCRLIRFAGQYRLFRTFE